MDGGVFSDESEIKLIGNDGRNFTWRRQGERMSPKCIKKIVEFGGGSVMIWGIMSAAGVGPLVRIQGTVNADVYKRIL